MSVDFNEFSRRMDKTLEVLGENFGSVRQAGPMRRFWTASAWNTMDRKRL